MEKGKVLIFTGRGHGKTPAALGSAMIRAARGERIVVIQFLKGKGLEESAFCARLDPEIKIFRFEKSPECFDEMTDEQKEEEKINIRNGLGYARKVLSTGECDLLVLDEVLGIVENGIITVDELKTLVSMRGRTDIILTGIVMDEQVFTFADEISEIETVKFRSYE